MQIPKILTRGGGFFVKAADERASQRLRQQRLNSSRWAGQVPRVVVRRDLGHCRARCNVPSCGQVANISLLIISTANFQTSPTFF